MKPKAAPALVFLLILGLLQMPAAGAARDKVDVHAYLNDSCIVADEPFFVPQAKNGGDSEQMTPKFLPLVGLVVGKLVELFINREIEGKVKQIKSVADRKDTRYAVTNQMNLYRADLQAAPVLGINGKLGCMTIVAAHLKPDGVDCTAAYAPMELDPATRNLPPSEWKTSRADDSIENQLRRANVCVDGNAWAVYEARFEFSKDGTAFRLKDAGYRIISLLTTQDKGASRTALYTLKISQPAATDQLEVLSSAWVKLGTVTSGAKSNGSPDDSAPWLRVPPMSVEARRTYEEKTGTHQQLTGEIEALRRAIVRNQRVIDGLDRRIADAGGDLVEGLKQERTKAAVQVQVQGAELDARNVEFRELPHAALEFMPVEIEVAVTETESEKKSQLALADIIGKTGGAVASAVGSEVSGMISRSVKVSDTDKKSDNLAYGSEFARARAQYFDALVDVQTSPSQALSAESQRTLLLAKARYNEARRSQGLEPIK
jgi:hypothetical protein